MKRLILPLSYLFFVLLTSCAPTPTIAPPEPGNGCEQRPVMGPLCFIVLPSGDLAAVTNAPIEYGDVRVAGEQLELRSPFCAVENCLPNERGFIRLVFPDEENKTYGTRLELLVVSGTATVGRALMTLQGEDQSREALLTTP